nr:DUF4279 domain-containing protein [Microvirga flavescens]
MRIDFVVRADDVSPDEITSIIGLQPTSISRKGAPRPQGGIPRVNLWVLSAPEEDVPDANLENQWARLAPLLESRVEVIKALKHQVQLEIIVKKQFDFPKLMLPQSMLALCYRMGVEIKIALYDLGDDPSEGEL